MIQLEEHKLHGLQTQIYGDSCSIQLVLIGDILFRLVPSHS